MGLKPADQVVCYDSASGGVAARLWWMLRWAGHNPAAVLDGGLASHPSNEFLEVRKRMAPVFACRRRREIAVEAREQRARDVRFAVLLLAKIGLHQVVPAVEYPPCGEVVRELLRRNQGGMHDPDYGRNSS